jgi:hypothetical protein
MQFLKKHYEKLILCVVLLALAVAAVMLSIRVSQVKRSLKKSSDTIASYPKTPLKPVDLSVFEASLAVHTNPPTVAMTSRHFVFNTVRWYKKPDGSVVKIATGKEIGIGALQCTQIKPLKRIVSLEGVSGTAEKPRFSIGIIKQGSTNKLEQNKKMVYASPQDKNKFFYLKEVKGEALNPTELVLTWLEDESNEDLIVSKAAPSEKVTDHIVDLAYPPDNLEFKNKRLNEAITIAGENYIIIAITEMQVVMSAERNQKRTIVPLRATP